MSDSFHDLKSLDKIRPHHQATQSNRFALFVLVTAGLSIFNTLLLLINAFTTSGIANRPLPTMVQLANGKTIEVSAFEGKNRSPQLIRDFTVATMTRLYTWQRYLPLAIGDDPHNPKVDPGAPVESKSGKTLVPTSVWAASFALSDKFREEFLGESVAPLLAKLGVLQGQSEVSLRILDLQDPIEVKGDGNERLWRVNLISNIVLRSSANVPEKIIPLNKTIYLRAIYPTAISDATKSADNKDLAKVVAMAGASGLQIYAVENIKVEDTQPMQQSMESAPTNAVPNPNVQNPAPINSTK
jgi:hypothetical protein